MEYVDLSPLLIPQEANIALLKALVLLNVCLVSLTYPKYAFIRLLLAPAIIWYFIQFILHIAADGPSRSITAGMTAIGCYGVMRVLEHTLIQAWPGHGPAPRWIQRAEKDSDKAVYVYPINISQRLFYSFDLLTSQRGLSWDAKLTWEWCPAHFTHWEGKGRLKFIFRRFQEILFAAVVLDVCEHIIKHPTWYPGSDRFPELTGLPLAQQLVYTLLLCVGSSMSIVYYYGVISIILVLCGSNPDTWPPMFDSPFSATSLKDFWSKRWHVMFRRVFERLSSPLFHTVGPLARRRQGLTITIIRIFIIFTLSALLHKVIMYEVMVWDYRNSKGRAAPSFWDINVTFFMAQPFGLLIETFVVEKMAIKMFPNKALLSTSAPSGSEHGEINTMHNKNNEAVDSSGGPRQALPKGQLSKKITSQIPPHQWQRELMTRIYAWCFLLWTGRWWAETWMAVGLFDPDENLTPLTLCRVVGGKYFQFSHTIIRK